MENPSTQTEDKKKKCGSCTMMFVFAVALFLVLLYMWVNKSEQFRTTSGIGVGQSYTSGATMRFNSELSSTNQQPYSVPRNAQVLDAMPGVRKEHLAVDRTTMLTQEDELAKRLFTEQFESPVDLVASELSAAKSFM
jgi:hypothetical protein